MSKYTNPLDNICVASLCARASNIVTAVFSVTAGSITGILGFNFLKASTEPQTVGLAIQESSTKDIDPPVKVRARR